jgi:hypothetical protein
LINFPKIFLQKTSKTPNRRIITTEFLKFELHLSRQTSRI